jgi:hypothetical protein
LWPLPNALQARSSEWGRIQTNKITAAHQQLRQSNLAPIGIGEIEQEVEFLMSR